MSSIDKLLKAAENNLTYKSVQLPDRRSSTLTCKGVEFKGKAYAFALVNELCGEIVIALYETEESGTPSDYLFLKGVETIDLNDDLSSDDQ